MLKASQGKPKGAAILDQMALTAHENVNKLENYFWLAPLFFPTGMTSFQTQLPYRRH